MDWRVSVEIFAAMIAGGFTVRLWSELRDMRSLKDSFAKDYRLSLNALNALRNNCFVTNEKGHRVRYRDASVEVRERAERN